MTRERWAKLVQHFMSEDAKVKSEAMVDARQEVVTINPYGRSGAAGKAAKLKA